MALNFAIGGVEYPEAMDNVKDLVPTGTSLEFQFDNALQFLLYLMPDFVPHPKQAAALLLMSGYTDPALSAGSRMKYTEEAPLMFACPAANGSGKDMVILATFVVFIAITGCKNRAIVTSSSFEQLRYQTEPHIKTLVELCNKKLGKMFTSVLFHHVCTRTASEIKLFCTDEAGRAEGFHPWPNGKMGLFLNEVKSIKDDICAAFRRCTGFSWWVEVSSPGLKSGHFYRSCRDGIRYPERLVPGGYYTLQIKAEDCPHIPRSHIAYCRKHMEPQWVASSIDAEFMDSEVDVVIPRTLIDLCHNTNHSTATDIAISLDAAAGGDETSLYVRRGANVIESFHFTQRDTTMATIRINNFLLPFINNEYIFWADDGGIGRAYIDNLTALGWRITRVRNESSARRKTEFLNRGAELYFHMKRLVAQKLINIPDDDKLRSQLASRRYDNLAQGKFRLEAKEDHKLRCRESPDRADSFVLCFGSFGFTEAREKSRDVAASEPTGYSMAEIAANPRIIERLIWRNQSQESKTPHKVLY